MSDSNENSATNFEIQTAQQSENDNSNEVMISLDEGTVGTVSNVGSIESVDLGQSTAAVALSMEENHSDDELTGFTDPIQVDQQPVIDPIKEVNDTQDKSIQQVSINMDNRQETSAIAQDDQPILIDDNQDVHNQSHISDLIDSSSERAESDHEIADLDDGEFVQESLDMSRDDISSVNEEKFDDQEIDITSQTQSTVDQTDLTSPNTPLQESEEQSYIRSEDQNYNITIPSQDDQNDTSLTQPSNDFQLDQSTEQVDTNQQDRAVSRITPDDNIQSDIPKSPQSQQEDNQLHSQDFTFHSTTESKETPSVVRVPSQQNTIRFDNVVSDPLTEFARAAEQSQSQDNNLNATDQAMSPKINQIENPFVGQITDNYDLGSDVSGIEFFDNLPVQKGSQPSTNQIASTQEQEEITLSKLLQTLTEQQASMWISSSTTRQLLSGLIEIDTKHLSIAGLAVDYKNSDPVKEVILKCFGEGEASKRQVLTVDSVTQDEEGLKQLLLSNCFHAALELSGRLLTRFGQGYQNDQHVGHSLESLQIWMCRIALLIKLNMFGTAEAEMIAFGDLDNPDLYFEYYPEKYPNLTGCIVPFAMRIIHAELPQFTGKLNESLDRLYRLHYACLEALNNIKAGLSAEGSVLVSESAAELCDRGMKLWQSRDLRVLFGIGNCLLALKEFSLAVKVFESICKLVPESELKILSGIGRIYLQLGDVDMARRYFKKVESKATGDARDVCMTVMNRGFLSIGLSDYKDAYKHFIAARKLEPNNKMALNNLAVCLVYCGKLKQAVVMLEELVWKDPPDNLDEGLLFNLCICYELESSLSLQKKLKLLELVGRHKGDAFNLQCLKIA
ncbi:uncharacterized protein TRIADDRAFT_57962 [Trichoplax adhaerens]|uniref:Uncharacterized protein n=1 Tax=Trichoplax adhaerens TaxID=10228 RepID=B3S283_TRIAD|nr:hypothetical protein TRIADDRAFT_57962 [Trichoplax adhaerens]EDV23069.1 hypothetical protein TRIADDRAFT_57962 [Trichoplax adhaerens]|eukprot:XP_002113979.1 hypothetical protein TRIADDRAFT_57962 [Trichoplax adhaerens]